MQNCAAIILAFVAVGCVVPNAEAAKVDTSTVHLRDTKTVANPEATHVWVFFQDTGGNDRLLYCDASFAAAGHSLCVRYPETATHQ